MTDSKAQYSRRFALSATTLISLCAHPAFSQTFQGTETTSGPFNEGEHRFLENSTLNALTAEAVSGGVLTFNDNSVLNASVANAISDGTLQFRGDSVLNASATDVISSGKKSRVLSFFDNATMNVSAVDALSGATVGFSGNSVLNVTAAQTGRLSGANLWRNTSTFNAMAADALSTGTVALLNRSVLNASAASAISGGTATLRDNSVLNATAGNAINGGTQDLRENSSLNASAEGAISRGFQRFTDSSILNATAEAAIVGGTQTFAGTSTLNASASLAVSGGTQQFAHSSILNATAPNAVSSGFQMFHDDSALNAYASDAVIGGNQDFHARSTFNASAARALSGGDQYFLEQSSLNASLENAISGGYQRFTVAGTLNAMAPRAVSGGLQNFERQSVLNASAESAISGGTQIFGSEIGGTLKASVSNAIVGGEQIFYEDAVLEATAENAITGGLQRINENGVLNARTANAVNGGEQILDQSGVLNVLADNALGPSSDILFSDDWKNTSNGHGGTLKLNGFSTTIGRFSDIDFNFHPDAPGDGVYGGRIENGGTSASTLTINTLDVGPGRYSGVIQDGGEGALSIVMNGGHQTLAGTTTHSGGVAVHAGTLVLTGVKNYTGGTRMLGGVLSVSQDESLGAPGQELFFDGGTLRVTGSEGLSTARAITIGTGGGVFDVVEAGNTLHANNQISGEGDLIKQGEGDLRLSGDNAYANTRIEAGTVFGSIGTIPGNVVLSGEATGFTLTNDADGTFEHEVSGNGQFVLDGAGTVLLTGSSSTFAGHTSLRHGTLFVGDANGIGSLGGSLDVLGGSMLGGSGTVGSGTGSLVTVASDGVLAPGNSIGTLTIDGDLVFDAGSRFDVEVNPEGTESDLVTVTGNVTLNGGTVSHIGATGQYKPRATYTILSADGTLSGAFDGVTSVFAFLSPELIYDYADSGVDLVLQRNDRDLSSVAETGNQEATAEAIDSIGPDAGNPVYETVVTLPDDATLIRASFDAHSGEVHASVKTAMIEDSRFIREAANDRIRAAFGDTGASGAPVLAYGPDGTAHSVVANHAGPVFWSHGFGSWASNDGNGNAATLDRSIGGMLVGADSTVADWRVGLLAGYSHSSYKVSDRAASAASDSYHLGLYGGQKWNSLALRTGAAYTWHNIEAGRAVAIPGFSDSLTADYNARTFQAFSELAYSLNFETEMRFEPFANLAYVNLRSGGFTEHGGAASLTGTSGSQEVTFTTIGVRAEHNVSLGALDTTFNGMLGWRHAFGDTTPMTTQAFSAGDAFTIAGVPIARDSLVIETGFDLSLTDNAKFGLAYQSVTASGLQDHGMKANLNVRF
ncbi:autotransporter domain-containing protein [Ochrobactrum sp. AN78]|uniref:autotransporter domain-containing protein n=1 Tax=Ochrobactrum sp. AN78 TaxID=3039853 RepID=UPI002989B9EE|nr:autotransporter domain-containing protein [Ochrobactrum sp. AN78]MDH7791624.1 outer membrane autotransporter protein [Ochrobactrum sp. AN78]